MSAKKFREKPIEAMQYDGTPETATPIIEWVLDNGGTARYICSDPDRCNKYAGDCPHWIGVRTLEGEMRAILGDWVIRGVQGEFYRCKPDVFAASYVAV